ncbi:hypothetical protein HDV00_011653 [Rhizophlyctis rosea]|nr:hypothetical protein HDV00_011653 [Rhizophlyctis rosea]
MIETTLDKFEAHLRSRDHRERVDDRLGWIRPSVEATIEDVRQDDDLVIEDWEEIDAEAVNEMRQTEQTQQKSLGDIKVISESRPILKPDGSKPDEVPHPPLTLPPSRSPPLTASIPNLQKWQDESEIPIPTDLTRWIEPPQPTTHLADDDITDLDLSFLDEAPVLAPHIQTEAEVDETVDEVVNLDLRRPMTPGGEEGLMVWRDVEGEEEFEVVGGRGRGVLSLVRGGDLGGGGGGDVEGKMKFDAVNLRWLSVDDEGEEDVFAGIDDEDGGGGVSGGMEGDEEDVFAGMSDDDVECESKPALSAALAAVSKTPSLLSAPTPHTQHRTPKTLPVVLTPQDVQTFKESEQAHYEDCGAFFISVEVS